MSSISRYDSLVRQLYQLNLTCQAKLGLDNIIRLHSALGEPLKSVPNIIHVGGTNGKGSVAFKVARSLQYSGLRTGLFVSPHISSFRERMQVDGTLISEEEVVSLLSRIFTIRDTKDIPATFFEVTAAMAFQFFAQRRLDAAVVEVGLGGRLDATNILTPRVSIITSIGLDHVKILGPTVEDVAREKAGIMKKGVPVILGPNTPLPLMQDLATRAGASPVILAPSGPFVNFEEENTAIAKAVIDELRRDLPFTEEGIARGVASRPPARFELLRRRVDVSSGRPLVDGPDSEESGRRQQQLSPGGSATKEVDIVMDVGHNGPAMTRLFEWLTRHFGERRRFRVVLGLSADKDVGECLDKVLEVVTTPDRLHLVQAAHPRAMPGGELAAVVKGRLGAVVPEGQYYYADVGQGVRAALQRAAASVRGEEGGEVVVVCGTFFIMGEARQALGFDEPIDSKVVAEMAGSHFRSMQEVFASSSSSSSSQAP